MDQDDEVVLNVLLAEDYDPATAYAAAQRDSQRPASRLNWRAVLFGVLMIL